MVSIIRENIISYKVEAVVEKEIFNKEYSLHIAIK